MRQRAEKFEKASRYGVLLGWFSIIGNIALFVLKFVAGTLSGSVALVADAWHTLTDSLSSVILIIGLRISRKPPDQEHPFGHGRAEWISSLMIGVFLIVIGVSFVQESIERLMERREFEFGLIAWIAVISSILVKEIMAQLCFRGAKKYALQSLKADGWHHRTDSLSSVMVLIGLIFGQKFWWIDGVLGILVSILIFVAAFEIMKEGISNMMGRRPDPEILEKIRLLVENNCVKNVHMHHIRIHSYGHFSEMTAHIKLPPKMSLETAHEIANQIEELIENEMDIKTTIHTEPLKE